MKTILVAATLAALAGAAAAQPTGVNRLYAAPTAPIATSAAVPAGYQTIYISGLTPATTTPAAPGGAPAYGDTEAQAETVFAKIEAALAAQGASAGDVVSMHVFLVGDPANGGKMDFAGMMKAYLRHFGTPSQPNKPTRTTVQVAALGQPGFLIEVDCIAVKQAGPR